MGREEGEGVGGAVPQENNINKPQRKQRKQNSQIRGGRYKMGKVPKRQSRVTDIVLLKDIEREGT